MGVITRLAQKRTWIRNLPATAWFDGPDAASEIDERSADRPADRRILESWVQNGYAVVEGVVPHEAIDAMLEDLDASFLATIPRPGIEFFDLEFGEDGHRQKVDHAQLLRHPVAERLAARDRSSWRVHAFVEQSAPADAVRRHPELQRIASMILGVDTKASYSINFQNGSVQDLHQDCAVFHLGVPNLIVGAWIACEDIVDTSGPLAYYPGSHRDSMYAEFDDYPNTNLRTASDDVAARYTRHVLAATERFEEHRFLARKGDVLFWHGMLIHGGAPIIDRSTTRRSLVLHFIPRGADAFTKVTLPSRW
jgi:ectoine hydroxylase-related dioxygenase (phytanoyl-CoA dioxygenase family)